MRGVLFSLLSTYLLSAVACPRLRCCRGSRVQVDEEWAVPAVIHAGHRWSLWTAFLMLLGVTLRLRRCARIGGALRLKLCGEDLSFVEVTTGAALRQQLSSPVGLAMGPWMQSPTWGASCSTPTTPRPRPGRLRGRASWRAGALAAGSAGASSRRASGRRPWRSP